MNENESSAVRFEEHRAHLRGVAYRMLGSFSEAEDAVQDAWLRMSRAGTDEVENLGGWLTTVVARVCLNMLRSRNLWREDPFGVHVPDPVISPDSGSGIGSGMGQDRESQPEAAAVLADSVGLALLVVLDTLTPAERVAFVLHDMFELPFEEIAPLVDRTPAAARQLASRARRRVKGAEVPVPDSGLGRQRKAVEAFFLAARGGDLNALVAVLDPEVVLRIDAGTLQPAASMVVIGASAVAGQALTGLQPILARPGLELHPALVNGAAGVVVTRAGKPVAVLGFTVVGGLIAEIDAIADPERVRRLAAGFSA